MGVPLFQPNQKAPIGAIIDGLRAAESYYGIKGASAKADALEQANQISQEESDPNSAASKGAQQAQSLLLDAARKQGVIKDDNYSALHDTLFGKPAEADLSQPGPDLNETPAVPGISARALKDESNPFAQLTKLTTGKMAADAATIRLSTRDDQLQKRLDTQQHTKNMEDMGKDKSVQDAVGKAQNLTNVINNVEQTGKITPQDVHDIQQISTQNMGLGSAGGVHERAARYASSLGLKAAEVEQFLSGNFQDIGQDNPLYSRYKDLMQMEVQNFKDRIGSKLDTYPAKYGTMYKDHPDWSGDINTTKQKILDQIPSFNNPTNNKKGNTKTQGGGGGGSDIQAQAQAIAKQNGWIK